MDTEFNHADAAAVIVPKAAKRRAKAKLKTPAKKKAKPAAKKAKAKKPKAKKAVKAKRPKAKKPKAKKAAKAKPSGVVRSERLDMRLSKPEKAKVLAKAKKLRRTVTSIVLEAIEKIK